MIKIETMYQFQQYLSAVEGRVDHHAGRVKSTMIILAGMVAAKATPGSVGVRTYAGATKNVVWFTAAGTDYCMSYNHDEECVDIRIGGLQGTPFMQVNDDDLSWISSLADALSPVAIHAAA
jgi:hypothetical protein